MQTYSIPSTTLVGVSVFMEAFIWCVIVKCAIKSPYHHSSQPRLFDTKLMYTTHTHTHTYNAHTHTHSHTHTHTHTLAHIRMWEKVDLIKYFDIFSPSNQHGNSPQIYEDWGRKINKSINYIIRFHSFCEFRLIIKKN